MCRGVEVQVAACTVVKIIQTNITPGSAVLDRNLPRLLSANKCIACEIKAKTSVS